MGTWSKGAALRDLLFHSDMQAPNKPDATAPIIAQVNRVPVARNLHTPESWEQRNAEQFRAAGALNNVVERMGHFNEDPDPAYDWAAKAEGLSSQIAQLKGRLAGQRSKNAHIRTLNSQVHVSPINVNAILGGSGGGNAGGGGGGNFAAFVRAISGQESGGNYGAVNSSSGALGKYQIMPGNIPSWSQQALGHSISTSKFLHSPKLQEAIARHKLHEYYSKYGVRGAASAWYSGDPNKYKNNSPQGGYPSIAAYVAAIIRRMHGG